MRLFLGWLASDWRLRSVRTDAVRKRQQKHDGRCLAFPGEFLTGGAVRFDGVCFYRASTPV